jgi:hypothetical protein
MVTDMVPLPMVDVREYLDSGGRSPYAEWFDGLNAQAAAKVAVVVTRLGKGIFPKSRESAPVFTNTQSTSAQVTGFTLARMATA